jgi:ribosomal protein RSM22 (predicted rRNA methylase)
LDQGIKNQIHLPKELTLAWYQALLEAARLPKGVSKSSVQEYDREFLDTLVRQEKRSITNLWETFTQERSELRRGLLAPKEQVVAYLLGFHLCNAARMQSLLARLTERYDLLKQIKKYPEIVVSDLGCGTGAMSQSFLSYMGNQAPKGELHLTDSVGGLLDTAKIIHTDSPLKVRTFRKQLEDLPADKLLSAPDHTLYVYQLGYVWNELQKNPRARKNLLKLFQLLLNKSAPGLIMIVDAGEQQTSRNLMGLRDELVQMGFASLYPCTSNEPCPLLERNRDWCFSESQWQPPNVINRVDRLLGIDHSTLSTTALTFATPAFASTLKNRGKVVVGRPESLEGKGFEYLLCSEGAIAKEPGSASPTTLDRGQLF